LKVPEPQAQSSPLSIASPLNREHCRNLDADDRCTIYEIRPLVCRIYPMEINPHIPLRPEAMDCPSEAWQSGPPLIHGQHLVDRRLAELIERSRQADRDDIRGKVAICQALGIDTSDLNVLDPQLCEQLEACGARIRSEAAGHYGFIGF
jgi:hypothetical protein